MCVVNRPGASGRASLVVVVVVAAVAVAVAVAVAEAVVVVIVVVVVLVVVALVVVVVVVIVVVVVVVVVVRHPPPVRCPDLLFFGLVVVGNAVFYGTFFRSYRKWQLFLVPCVVFVAFRTLFINLAPKIAGIYSTCLSEFLDFLLFFEVWIFAPKT